MALPYSCSGTDKPETNPNVMQTRIVLSLLSMMILAGCYRDNEEALTPCNADTEEIHYSTITSILSNNGCYGCHLGTAPEGGISLEQYTSVKALVDNGRLVGAITHAAGFTPMPQGGAKISDCDISRIKAWIAGGAQEH